MGCGGMIAGVVLLFGRDLRENPGGDRRLLEAKRAFDQRDAIGHRVRIERDDAASPIDRFRAVLSLRDGREHAAGVRAFGFDRVGALRCHRGPAEIIFVESDMSLPHQLVLLPAHVKAVPAPADNDQEAEHADQAQAKLDVGMLGPLKGGLER